ncbi:hypothetical protein KGQ20_39515 [Catenulispora sp. NF23]|uniref:RapZ C-terminal domain-containing protein n=1 Tax=Catenulispora pinistramenti TaxID=2705254 RepID=UPI001BA7C92A|nr:RNase adapter RapZ [Catenulispora pinistramenti]MBS2538853.1 hypothetical protein [Catenulispora pinistramenti]
MRRIRITTFGVLHGAAPEGDALTVDLRTELRNPHDDPAMRELTGLDERVREHVLATPGARRIVRIAACRVVALDRGWAGSRDRDLLMHVFCQGGRHRSVAIAEAIAVELRAVGYDLEVVHRDIDKPVVRKTPITYFWFAEMAWPSARGPVTWSRWNTFTSADPVSRAEVLGWILDLAHEDGAPKTAGLTNFTLECDQVAASAETASVLIPQLPGSGVAS